MKIQIVDSSVKAKRGMFENLIKNEFANQKQILDTETEFYVRNGNDIDDFLYEQASGFLKKDSGMKFDNFDIIFITGNANLLPWSPNAKKVLILLRMCLKSKKMVFASGFAFFCLVFLCATNQEKGTQNIINGNGKGSKQGDLHQLKVSDKRLESTEVFLDNVTGDIYNYNYDTSEWAAKYNIGIHYQRAAEEFTSLGKYVISTPVFRVKTVDKREICVSRKNESICYLRKMFLGHWSVENTPFEYLAPNLAKWQVHTFNFRVPEKTFNVLAESKIGPQIILFTNDNVLATAYELDLNYPDTLPPLSQFIKTKLLEIKSLKKSQITSIFAVDGTWQDAEMPQKYKNVHNDTLKNMYVKANKEPGVILFKPEPGREHSADRKFRFSGMASRQKGFQYSSNNAIGSNKLVNPAMTMKKVKSNDNFLDRTPQRQQKSSYVYFNYDDFNSHLKQTYSPMDWNKMTNAQMRKMATNLRVSKPFGVGQSLNRTNYDLKAEEKKVAQHCLNLNKESQLCRKEDKHTIRQTLLSDWENNPEHNAKNDDWAPGYRTFFKIFNNKNTCGQPTEDNMEKNYIKAQKQEQNMEEESARNIDIDTGHYPVIRKSCKPRFYSRFNKEFKHRNPDDQGNSYLTTIGIPYITPKKVEKLYELEKDKGIMFHPYVVTGMKTGPATLNIMQDQSDFYKSSNLTEQNYNRFANSVRNFNK